MSLSDYQGSNDKELEERLRVEQQKAQLQARVSCAETIEFNFMTTGSPRGSDTCLHSE